MTFLQLVVSSRRSSLSYRFLSPLLFLHCVNLLLQLGVAFGVVHILEKLVPTGFLGAHHHLVRPFAFTVDVFENLVVVRNLFFVFSHYAVHAVDGRVARELLEIVVLRAEVAYIRVEDAIVGHAKPTLVVLVGLTLTHLVR